MNKSTSNIVMLAVGLVAFIGASYIGMNNDATTKTATRPATQQSAEKTGAFHCRVDFDNGAALTDVEIAKTKKQMEQGYQNRTSADDGMLYVWSDEDFRVFYSRNIIIPIDLIYIDASGTVVDLKQMGIKNDKYIKATHKAKYVLELGRSMATLLQIKPGLVVAVSDCK